MRTGTQKIEKIYIGVLISNQGSSGNHWVHALDLYISELNKKALLNNFKVCRHSHTHVLVLPDLGEPDWHSFKLILRGSDTYKWGISWNYIYSLFKRENYIWEWSLEFCSSFRKVFIWFALSCRVNVLFILQSSKISLCSILHCSLAKYHSAVYYTAV